MLAQRLKLEPEMAVMAGTNGNHDDDNDDDDEWLMILTSLIPPEHVK